MNDVQKVILSIFKEVDNICRRHDIPYYAIGGTCIGVVRHKGFIPWDDDIDIAVPIEHYEFFLNLLRKELPEHLYVLSPDDCIHYPNIFSKVCDDRTTFVMESSLKYKDSYKGIFIDVMPISGIPSNRILKSIFIKRIKIYKFLNQVRRFGGEYKSIGMFFINAFTRLFDANFFSKKYLSLLKRYPFATSNLIGYVWWPNWMPRLIFPQSFFGTPIEMPFENVSMKCPCDYDKYLTFQFGDYMTPPPVKEQQIHGGLIDVNRPFTYYVDKEPVASI